MHFPFVPAKAGTQSQRLDSRLRGNERSLRRRARNAIYRFRVSLAQVVRAPAPASA